MTDEPETEQTCPTFLIDYLYVDVARVRSYLAQLAGAYLHALHLCAVDGDPSSCAPS